MLVTILRVLLAAAAIINVYGCWAMNRRIAGVSKVFLMPLVIAIYFAKLAENAVSAAASGVAGAGAGNAAAVGGVGEALAGKAASAPVTAGGVETGMAVGGSAGILAALSIPLLLGMIAGYLGDLFLLKDSLFAAGLGAFLCGHIFYIIAFARDIVWKPSTALLLLVIIPYLIYILWLKKHLIPFVPKNMKAPVFIYMAAIVAMSVFAFLRFSAVGSGLSAEYIFYTFLGSVLFVASDSILAMKVFKRDVGSFMEVGVMITYVFAQFLIMWGMVNAL